MGEAIELETLGAQLGTTLLGRRIEIHRQVGSTNDLARQAAKRGEPEGLVVLAEEQVAGRGRLGRTWIAPPGCCILCSVLLRPRFSPEHAFYLTIAASLAIYRACKILLGQQTSFESHTSRNSVHSPQFSVLTIKWPNDVLLNGRKLSGVLCESALAGRGWDFCVIGLGINVNLSVEELGPLQNTATSLSIELGRYVDRAQLLAGVLMELERIYFSLHNGRHEAVRDEWEDALETIGKYVSVSEAGGIIEGQAVRIDHKGALVIRLASGEERHIVAGDVS